MTWMDEVVTEATGWEESSRVLDTFWFEDPAIDQEASDSELFIDTLEPSALKIVKGKVPVKMRVELPDPGQWAHVQARLSDAASSDDFGPIHEATIIAFSLCVTFPDSPGAETEKRLGHQRLKMSFIRALQLKFPSLVPTVGLWIMRHSQLTEQEKKVLSLESGQPSSPKKASTARAATKNGRSAKAAQTSAQSPSLSASPTT